MHGKNKSIIFVVYFFVILLCVIFFVVGFRFIKLWNTAKFDGKHQFILGTQGHDPTEVLIFHPDTLQIDTILFRGESDAGNLFTSAGVFVDAVVLYDSLLDPKDFHIGQYVRQQLFHMQNTSLNAIDFLRLWLFTESTKQGIVKKMLFTLPLSQSANTALDQAIIDKSLYQEGKTITVVNASTFYGEGSAIAAGLTAVGANIISVTTATSQENKSYISFAGKPTYTLQKLSQIIHIPFIHSENSGGLADITIVLGQDIKTRLRF